MYDFVARNGKQLTVCLKLLYMEKVPYTVKVEEDNKGKVIYIVEVDLEPKQLAELREKYRVMIS